MLWTDLYLSDDGNLILVEDNPPLIEINEFIEMLTAEKWTEEKLIEEKRKKQPAGGKIKEKKKKEAVPQITSLR